MVRRNSCNLAEVLKQQERALAMLGRAGLVRGGSVVGFIGRVRKVFLKPRSRHALGRLGVKLQPVRARAHPKCLMASLERLGERDARADIGDAVAV